MRPCRRSGALAGRHCPARQLPPARDVWRAPPGSHNSLKIKKAIESAGAGLRFLPRYPPGFNPVAPAASPGDVLET
jgi:hypothetical protein